MSATNFLNQVLNNATLQERLRAYSLITPDTWVQVGAQAGYMFTADELEEVLNQDFGLVQRIWALNLPLVAEEVELSDAQLEAIAAGAKRKRGFGFADILGPSRSRVCAPGSGSLERNTTFEVQGSTFYYHKG